MRILSAKDSFLKEKVMELADKQDSINVSFHSVEERKGGMQLGFYLLGDLATNAVPALVDTYLHPPSPNSAAIANSILMQLFPARNVMSAYWVPAGERAQWYLDAGYLKSQSGALSNAILAFTEALRLDPTNVDACLGRGGARAELQDFKGAMEDVAKAIEFSPSNHSAFWVRGYCKFALKDFRSAETDFTTAIDLATNQAALYNDRGLARANMRNLTEALVDFNKAIELSPWEAEFYHRRAMVEGLQKEYELALTDASRAIELDDHAANTYITRGRINLGLKEYNAALADFDKAIGLNSTNAAAYAARGGDWVYMNEFVNASADLEKALRLDLKTVTAFTARGFLKAKRGGEDDAALADFERAAALAPAMPEAYGILGLFQYKACLWEPALANCRKALELGALASVDEFYAYIWLIRAQWGEEADAHKELDSYLKCLPEAKTNDWSVVVGRFFAGSLGESHFLELATISAKRQSAIKGQVCESFYYAGMKRKLGGDSIGAAKLFQKCLDTQDDNSVAFLNAAVELRALPKP